MRENFLELLRSKFYELNAAEQKVANYVLAEGARVQSMSISELARHSGVSEATVTRFCKKLELQGFFSLKLELAKLSPESREKKDTGGRALISTVASDARAAIDETAAAITEEQLNLAVSMIERAERVLAVGFGSTSFTAEAFVSVFSSASLKFFSVNDVHLQTATLSMLGEEDLVILFSYSGATNEGTELLKFASELGIPTILITHFPESPSAEYSSLTLTHAVDEHPYRAGSVPVRIAQLVLIDMLWRTYEERNTELCSKVSLKRAEALAKKHK